MRSRIYHFNNTTPASLIASIARWFIDPSKGLWVTWIGLSVPIFTISPALFLAWIATTMLFTGSIFMYIAYLIPPPPRLSERHALLVHIRSFMRGVWGAAVLALGAVIGAMVGVDAQYGSRSESDRWLEIFGEYLGVIVGFAALGAWIWAMGNCALDLMRTRRATKVHFIGSALQRVGFTTKLPGSCLKPSGTAAWLTELATSLTCTTSGVITTALVSGITFPMLFTVALTYARSAILP